MKTLTRRELFREMVSKDTLRQVVHAWKGFSDPLNEGLATKKQETLLDKVKKLNAKNANKNNGKEG